jgi:hypothetical protein
VLEVDAHGQRRDVAAAPAAPIATAADWHGDGGEGLEKGVAWIVGLCLLCRWRESPGWPRVDKGGRVLSGPTQTVHI